MKRSLVLPIILMVILAFSAPAFCADYSKIIPAKPAVIIKINVKPFLNTDVFKNLLEMGEIKKALADTFGEFEKRTGLAITRDVTELFAAVSENIDIKAPEPNNFMLGLIGNFEPEKFMGELEKEKAVKGMIETEGGLKVIKKDKIWGAFLNKETFAVASPDVIKNFAAQKFESADLKGEMKSNFESSSIFIHVAIAGNVKQLLEANVFPKFTPYAKSLAEKLTVMTVYNTADSLMAEAVFSDKAACEEVKNTFNAMKGMAKQALSVEERKIDEAIKTASAFEMLKNGAANKKTSIAMGNEALEMLEFTAKENTAILKFKIPEQYKAVLKPEAAPILIAIGGIIAAIAVPNFKRARERALHNK